MKVPAYEYDMIGVMRPLSPEDLNARGAQGWLLVSVFVLDAKVTYHWRRRLPWDADLPEPELPV